ncbi:KilA-N domain-containing protein [Aeromonas enteropelogenes]|uniref:KilA-N domain-containing protein n=1 Tax=Aeromonas enteropelogenes TaxID=29489 RepID=UPI001CCA79D2|nr:KilA-N domain-containing protein [Aeromonas enteropelogenes]UBH29491.1 KilA-N domain-containing protein [Aeromonas enteropelogenes]
MKITFNGNTFTIPTNDQGQYHATSLSQAWAAAGGQINALDGWTRSLDEIQMRKFSVFKKRGKHGGGTWVNKRGLLAFAAYCSREFEDAVFDAFDELTKGNTMQAAAIAESVAVSPELLEKHDATRKAMNDAIKAKGIDMCGKAYGNFYRLACKAATGYVPSVLTGKNGSAKEYIKQVSNAPCMNALIACMETITMGLKVGLDYHKVAAMLNVETSQNSELLG